MMLNHGLVFDAARSFDAVVDWIHEEIIKQRDCPGLMVGLSGTDSLVAFIASYEALKRAGKPERLLGIHFAPSEDFLYDHPEAEAHNWFAEQALPWLHERCPGAIIDIDRSIDWRLDGARWGKMLDLSILTVDEHDVRRMRPHDEKYWIVGTRNRTEDVLFTYSRASLAASMQPLIGLWKSDILQISYYLRLPKIAIEKSCEADCICGRDRLPAKHVRELDTILMIDQGELPARAADSIPEELQLKLTYYEIDQIGRCEYKAQIPYVPASPLTRLTPITQAFENETLNLHGFSHREHLYIAWIYLQGMPFEAAVAKYSQHLRALLEKAGSKKFNEDITRSYFQKLQAAMTKYPTWSFDELMAKAGAELK